MTGTDPEGSESIGRAPLVIAVLVIAASIGLIIGLDGTTAGVWYDDIGEAVVATTAALSALRRARTVEPTRRRSWQILAIGCVAWTVGEAIWCWNELGYGRTPFPSVADIGFLAFAVSSCIALLLYPTDDTERSPTNRTFDAISTTAAFALIAWVAVLSPIASEHGDDKLAYAISLAYPLSDIAVLVLSVLTLSRVHRDRLSLLLMASGFIALSASDSAFASLQASQNYNGGFPDLGWFVGFVLITLGGLASGKNASSKVHRPTAKSKTALTFVPYIPLMAALVAMVTSTALGNDPSRGQLALGAALVLVLLARQYLTLRSNLALTTDLADREAELHHQAFHDNLTGLANRALFQDRLEHALELHARDLRPIGVIFLDLDDFKIVNDTLGHRVGDELLKHVADRIVGATRSGDTVARLGGDEFAVLVESSGDPTITAERITNALQGSFFIEEQQVTVTASLGIVSLDPEASPTTADLLITQADTAMYAAKRSGKGCIEIYREGMSLIELSDILLSTALAQDIKDGKLRVVFQPIFDLESGSINSIETLARWTHDGKIIPPDVFIPMAERTGVINDLTTYIIARACEQAVSCVNIPGYEDLVVGVNIPPQQIGMPTLEQTIHRMLDHYGIKPHQFGIEITETGLFANVEAAKTTIEQLRRSGVHVSLDDFGVGYSSLSQLHNIELDSVKIDRSFIERLEADERQVKFLQMIIRLGHDVNLKVVAEGVERPAQLEVLKRLGCPMAQGYLFAKPMTGTDLVSYLADTPRVLSGAPA